LVKIDQREADYLIKNVPSRKLKKASERKFYGGKTYYILNDDNDSLAVIAMLRGYESITTFVIGQHGKPKEKIVSPVEQLLRDN
jgi:hypothetical protein